MAGFEQFLQLCQSLNEEAFCRAHPHPVLVHCSLYGELDSSTSSVISTMDRIVVGIGTVDTAISGADEDLRRGKARYTIFVIAPETGNTISVGCSSGADVQIKDKSISKRHAVFAIRGKTVTVRDDSSSAGTQVNDVLLEAGREKVLDATDRITLGYVELVYLPPEDFYRFLCRQLPES
jgi:hypothetical protein